MRIANVRFALIWPLALSLCAACGSREKPGDTQAGVSSASLDLIQPPPCVGDCLYFVAGDGKTQGQDVDDLGAAAHFQDPCPVATDNKGILYVADLLGIRRVEAATGAVTSLYIKRDPGPVTALAYDGDSKLYFNEPIDLQISVVDFKDLKNIHVSAFATFLVGGLAFGPLNHLYGTSGDHVVQFQPPSNVPMTFVGSDIQGYKDGVGVDAQFHTPLGIAWDHQQTLYVADHGNHVIRKIDIPTAQVTTLAGTPGVSGMADGIGSAARFGDLFGSQIAIDQSGMIFVTDGSTIRRVDPTTAQVSTPIGVAGTSAISFGRLPATLKSPRGVAALGTGLVAIADGAGIVSIARLLP
jgi:hypothetical protein